MSARMPSAVSASHSWAGMTLSKSVVVEHRRAPERWNRPGRRRGSRRRPGGGRSTRCGRDPEGLLDHHDPARRVAVGQRPRRPASSPSGVGSESGSSVAHGRPDYSWTSSIRVPKAVLGCTKATVVPREPGRGASSMTRPPWSFTACRADGAVGDPVADVVQALALALEVLGHRRVVAGRREQLDVASRPPSAAPPRRRRSRPPRGGRRGRRTSRGSSRWRRRGRARRWRRGRSR